MATSSGLGAVQFGVTTRASYAIVTWFSTWINVINCAKSVHQNTVKKLIHQPERLGQSIVVPILTILKWRRRVKSLEALEFIQIYGCQNLIISLSHSDSRLYWLISGIFPLYGWQITLALRFCTQNPLGSHHFCLWNIHSWSFLGYAPFPDPIWIQSLAYQRPPGMAFWSSGKPSGGWISTSSCHLLHGTHVWNNHMGEMIGLPGVYGLQMMVITYYMSFLLLLLWSLNSECYMFNYLCIRLILVFGFVSLIWGYPRGFDYSNMRGWLTKFSLTPMIFATLGSDQDEDSFASCFWCKQQGARVFPVQSLACYSWKINVQHDIPTARSAKILAPSCT